VSEKQGLAVEVEHPLDCLPELLNLWDSCFGPDFPLDERLLSQHVRMEKALSKHFVLRDGRGKIIAALLAKRMYRPADNGLVPSGGNISYIMVDPQYRRRGLASKLWQEALAWLLSTKVTYVNFGRDTCHFFPGLPLTGTMDYQAAAAWCAAQGFNPGAIEHDVIANIEADHWPYQLSAGEHFGQWTFVDYHQKLHNTMCDFFIANFPGRWYADVLDGLAAGMRDNDLILVLDPHGTVRGFSRIYDGQSTVLGPGVYWRKAMGRNPGGLGPIGVDAGVRGEGLGLALLKYSLAVLQKRGVATVMIDWTDLTDFYAKLGFSIWKSYRLLTKTLE